MARSQEKAAEAEALERLVRLNEEFRARAIPDAPLSPPPSEPSAPKTRPVWSAASLKNIPPSKIIKSLLALVVAVALAWVPLSRLLSVTSAEATINARLINLRAPIDGSVVIVAPAIAVGTRVEPGEALLRVTNTRADRQGIDELGRTIDQLRAELAALEQRTEELKKIEAGLRCARAKRFRRAEFVSSKRAPGSSSSSSTPPRRNTKMRRSPTNRDKDSSRAEGFQTVSALLHSERDFKVAKTNIEGVHKRQQSNQVELEGARKGLFIGDSYNDRPRSAQHLDEVGQQIADLAGQRRGTHERMSLSSRRSSPPRPPHSPGGPKPRSRPRSAAASGRC